MRRFVEIPYEERASAVDRMADYGGSFVKALAAAWYAADETNKERLTAAFADLFDRYTEW